MPYDSVDGPCPVIYRENQEESLDTSISLKYSCGNECRA